jgi:hypothetical protein
MADDDAADVAEVAQAMLRHYGEAAHELMLDRSRNSRRHDEPVSAAFWDLVAQEVRRISSAVTC